MAPESSLAQKVTKIEKKKQNRALKRKIIQNINDQLKENISLTTLAESESMQAYKRKRFAMSFQEPPTSAKKAKLHSRGVATVVSMLPRNPLACRNVGGAIQKSNQPHPLLLDSITYCQLSQHFLSQKLCLYNLDKLDKI